MIPVKYPHTQLPELLSNFIPEPERYFNLLPLQWKCHHFNFK